MFFFLQFFALLLIVLTAEVTAGVVGYVFRTDVCIKVLSYYCHSLAQFRGDRTFLGLGDVALAFKFWGKLLAKRLKGNRLYRGKFHNGGKLHGF